MAKEIGIDLGTTNTVVSYIDKNDKLKSLKLKGNRGIIIPSAVFYKSKHDYVIGHEAIQMLKLNPRSGVKNFKSKMGSKEKYTIICEDGKSFKITAKDVAKDFLNLVIKGIEDKLIKEFGSVEGVLENVVITVPAKFSSTEKEATKWSAQEAGFRNVKLLAEPTAAAVGYQRESDNTGKVILVYDFGGGTFDVSVLVENNGVFNEITTGGDKSLGGNKLTENIVDFLLKSIEEDYDLVMPNINEDFDEEDFEDDYDISFDNYIKNINAIVDGANELKENISDNEEEDFNIDLILQDQTSVKYEAKFTRKDIETLFKKDIARTVEITKNVINEVYENEDLQIDEIILAGGSSQIPLVKEMLSKSIDLPIKSADNVSSIISRGAAVLANLNYSDGLIKAVTNVELGIEIVEGARFKLFEPLIGVNEYLPIEVKRQYSLKDDNQERLKIKIYERDIKNYPNASRVFDNGIEEIDELIISNLPSNISKNNTLVEVIFKAEVDGSLKVSAQLIDRVSGNLILDNNIEVNKSSNLE